MNEDKPFWYPTLTDAAWCAEIREEYELDADSSDEDVREEYADGKKYQTLWDHIGDAYEDFEPLADAYFEALARIKELEAQVGK